MKKVYHIHGRAPLFTNTFLLVTEAGHAVAIDPDAPAEKYRQLLEKEGAVLTHILLTHGHHDHVGSVNELRADGAKLYMNAADAAHFGIQPDEVYTDGGQIQVDEDCYTTIFTPGHTPGSTCIRCDALLFTGDTLFAGTVGRTDLPGGNYDQLMDSLKKLCDAVHDDPQVLPGHEDFSTMEQEKASNPYLGFAR